MGGLSGWVVVAVVAAGIAVAAAAALLVPPTRRLAGRVRPYVVPARTSLGRAADVPTGALPVGGLLGRLLGPPAAAAAGWVAARLDGRSDESILRRLAQADLLTGVPAQRRATELRVRELTAAATGTAAGVATGLLLPGGAAPAVLLGLLGGVVGATRWRSRIDRAIEQRRTRMRIELYTVNQLLALNVRVGGGVIQAVRRVVGRGNGTVIDELREVLRRHEAGVPADEAFVRAAALTPEPQVARTYRLLAAGVRHGADLARGLLDHSEDLRESRREAMKRDATRRRATMLVPIIAVLAPVMLLFIAAPLPSIVFGAL